MSLSPLTLKNSFSDVKEKLGFEIRIHGHEIIVAAVMTAVTFTIALALTGNVNEAFSRSNRGR